MGGKVKAFMKNRLAHLIPILGKYIRRYEAAARIIDDEWGDGIDDAKKYIDIEAGIIPKPPMPWDMPSDGVPYTVAVDYVRDTIPLFQPISPEDAAWYEAMDEEPDGLKVKSPALTA